MGNICNTLSCGEIAKRNDLAGLSLLIQNLLRVIRMLLCTVSNFISPITKYLSNTREITKDSKIYYSFAVQTNHTWHNT